MKPICFLLHLDIILTKYIYNLLSDYVIIFNIISGIFSQKIILPITIMLVCTKIIPYIFFEIGLISSLFMILFH